MSLLEPCAVCAEPGAWRCEACGPLCVAHVARLPGGRLRFRCGRCRGEASLLRARRSELTPFETRVRPALRAPLASGRSAVAWVLCGFALWLALPLSALGALVGVAACATFGMRLLKASADGESFEWPSATQAMDEIVLPLGRFFGATLPVWLAVVAILAGPVAAYRAEHGQLHTVLMLARSPVFWLAGLFMVAFMPFALVNALVASSWKQVLDPTQPIRLAFAWRRHYRWLALVAAGGALAAFLLAGVLHSGVVAVLLRSLFMAYVWLVLCRLAGEFVHLHPDELDWGRGDESWVDLADPLSPALAEAPAPSTRAAAAEMNTSLEGQITAALDAKDVATVLNLFRGSADAELQLSPPTLLRTGQAAAFASEYSLALQALTAAARTQTPEAAKALVIAARILDERLRDHVGARRLFEQAMERFPGSPAADYAEKQLRDPRFILGRRSG